MSLLLILSYCPTIVPSHLSFLYALSFLVESHQDAEEDKSPYLMALSRNCFKEYRALGCSRDNSSLMNGLKWLIGRLFSF